MPIAALEVVTASDSLANGWEQRRGGSARKAGAAAVGAESERACTGAASSTVRTRSSIYNI